MFGLAEANKLRFKLQIGRLGKGISAQALHKDANDG